MGNENQNTPQEPNETPKDQLEADVSDATQRIIADLPLNESFENITPVHEQAPEFRKLHGDQGDSPQVPTTRIEEMEQEVEALYTRYLETKDPELQRQMKKLHEEIFWRREENIPGKPVKKY